MLLIMYTATTACAATVQGASMPHASWRAVYADKHLLVVDKDAGLLTVRACRPSMCPDAFCVTLVHSSRARPAASRIIAHRAALPATASSLVLSPCPLHAQVPGIGAEKADCLLSRLQAAGHAVSHAAHRLDRDTSGLVALGLTKRAHKDLSVQFQERLVQKRYEALCLGWHAPLDEPNGPRTRPCTRPPTLPPSRPHPGPSPTAESLTSLSAR